MARFVQWLDTHQKGLDQLPGMSSRWAMIRHGAKAPVGNKSADFDPEAAGGPNNPQSFIDEAAKKKSVSPGDAPSMLRLPESGDDMKFLMWWRTRALRSAAAEAMSPTRGASE